VESFVLSNLNLIRSSSSIIWIVYLTLAVSNPALALEYLTTPSHKTTTELKLPNPARLLRRRVQREHTGSVSVGLNIVEEDTTLAEAEKIVRDVKAYGGIDSALVRWACEFIRKTESSGRIALHDAKAAKEA
jgi:hypothetical protein